MVTKRLQPCNKRVIQSPDFWQAFDMLVAASKIVIDRPRGTTHPRFPNMIYPLDYGYLQDTTSMDGHGIDVWQGSLVPPLVVAVIGTIDLRKKDSELSPARLYATRNGNGIPFP
jgi:inorganic pyrophosphatase